MAAVDDRTIHQLNRRYLDHDYPTDVLSFVLEEGPGTVEGEIIVSGDTAAASAPGYGWPAQDELLLYVIHGMLHLVGYDDKSPADAARMRQAEARLPGAVRPRTACGAVARSARRCPPSAIARRRKPVVTAGSMIIWAVASLLVAAIAATAARALRGLSRGEVEEACRIRRAEHVAREIMADQQHVALGAECLQVIASAVALSAIAECLRSLPAVDEWSMLGQFGLIAVVGSLALVAVNVWIPAALARIVGTPFIIGSWPLWRAVSRFLAPLLIVARQFEAFAQKVAGPSATMLGEHLANGDGRGMMGDGHRDGSLEEDAREMIEGVIQLGDAEVAQVMTPRTYMLSMRASLPLDEVVKFVITSGHTRIPVFDKNRDDIVGILHMKDLLPELMKPPAERAPDVKRFLRPALFVPETKRLDGLLQEFQQNRNHMAVVLDEFGGVSGLVTIEDVLEEIVGEIVDEYDDDLVEGIKSIDDHTTEVQARVRIDEVNERLGTHLPEDGDFDTIGGFVFSHLGHIPAVGESITVDEVRLTVIDVTRRRIERVRIEVLDPSRT